MSKELFETGSENTALSDPDEQANFQNRLAAWQYLQDTGWQIGRAQFYEHCKEGRLPRQPDGTYTRKAVDNYAKHHCRRTETGERVNDRMTRMAEEKAKIELEREKVRLERDRHELAVRRAEYIPRDEVELMIVARAVALLAHLKSLVQMRAPDWIALVEGQQERSRELIEDIWQGMEQHLATFARDVEFEVLLEKTTPAPAPAETDTPATKEA